MKKILKIVSLFILTLFIYYKFISPYLKKFDFNYYLYIKPEKNYILIQTLLLGEYYTPVHMLKIIDLNSNRNVVIFESKSLDSRMHTITLHLGINKFDDLYLENYNILFPSGINYKFSNKTRYKVVAIWEDNYIQSKMFFFNKDM